MPHTSIKPARHRYYSTELMTNVRGVHGHEAYCSCGWTGHTWREIATAKSEAAWHYSYEHGGPSANKGMESS